jgi:uncharacterized protein (TIGR02246 family)
MISASHRPPRLAPTHDDFAQGDPFMKLRILVLAVALGATGPVIHAQVAKKAPSAQPVAAASTEDEKAIQTLLDAFAKAFNAGDAAAVAATYTESAIVVDESGGRIEGQEAIQRQYADSFTDHPGDTIAIDVDSFRFLSPDAAIEMGRSTITSPKGGAPDVTRFTAVYVKEKGRWLQSVVRDDPSHDLTPHEHLLDLEWMLGEWVNESQDAVVATTCEWSTGEHFIDRKFTIKTRGEPVLSGTQRIGWDPLKRQFKTWIFDSQGGHGEGFLTHTGDRWVIKVEGVSSDGVPSSATNIVTRMGKDRMSWQSVDRTRGGAAVPGVDEFIVVRKPPPVGE